MPVDTKKLRREPKNWAQRESTVQKFDQYCNAVCKALRISKDLYRKCQSLIIQHMGYFDEDETYCGPGDNGDWLVPDFIFRFAGYVHDGLYLLIKKGILEPWKRWKARADKWFRVIMYEASNKKLGKARCFGWFMADLYYTAVSWFGTGSAKPEGL
jgi:hypothetical protein